MGQPKSYTDGSIYTGKFNDKGEKDGIGNLVFPNKIEYHGEFKSGYFEGHGVMKIPAGSGPNHKYEGQFSKGKFHGYGVFEQGNIKYEGQFEDGKIQGLGQVTFKDGANSPHGVPHYEGSFRNGENVERRLCPDAIKLAKEAATKAGKV